LSFAVPITPDGGEPRDPPAFYFLNWSSTLKCSEKAEYVSDIMHKHIV